MECFSLQSERQWGKKAYTRTQSKKKFNSKNARTSEFLFEWLLYGPHFICSERWSSYFLSLPFHNNIEPTDEIGNEKRNIIWQTESLDISRLPDSLRFTRNVHSLLSSGYCNSYFEMKFVPSDPLPPRNHSHIKKHCSSHGFFYSPGTTKANFI